MLNDGLDGRARSIDWRELVVFCVMAVALMATSDSSSQIVLKARGEGPTVVLDDSNPSASFLVRVNASESGSNLPGALSNAQLGLLAEATHSPVMGSPWVTVEVFDSAADAASSVTEVTSFLREQTLGIPTSFSGRCEPDQQEPNGAPCLMQVVVQFTRAAAPGVTTTVTWAIEAESRSWVGDGESKTYFGELPWEITVTPF